MMLRRNITAGPTDRRTRQIQFRTLNYCCNKGFIGYATRTSNGEFSLNMELMPSDKLACQGAYTATWLTAVQVGQDAITVVTTFKEWVSMW